MFTYVLKMFWTAEREYENKRLTRRGGSPMTHLAQILSASRSTLIADALGMAAIGAMTLGLLHLPALV